MVGTLAALGICGLLQRRRRLITAFPRELAIGILLATALFAAAVVSSSAVDNAAGDLRTLMCLVGVMVVCGLSPPASRVAMRAIMAAGVVVAVVLLAEERGLYLPALGSLVTSVLVRPTAMMPHRNAAAAYLFVTAVLLAGAALSAERRRGGGLAAALFGVTAAALTATASRSALAATLLAAVYLACKMRPRRWPARVALLLAAATLAIALRGWKGPAAPYSLSSKLAATVSMHDFSRRERLTLARFTLDEIAEHPLVGEGRLEWQRRWTQAHPDSTLTGTDDTWLDLAVAYGLPCMLVVGVGGFGLGRLIWRARRGDGRRGRLAGVRGGRRRASALVLFEDLVVMPGVNVALGVVLGVVVSTEWTRTS